MCATELEKASRCLCQNFIPLGKRHQNMATATTDSYDSTHQYRGVALVIVNEDFDPPREGAIYDEMNMIDLFEKLQFKVFHKSNLTAAEVTTQLHEGMEEYHRNSDCCFVFVISTHGKEIQSGDGTYLHQLSCMKKTFITTQEIVNIVSECDALQGKPKLFFIQACRYRGSGLGRDLGHVYKVKNDNSQDEARACPLSHTTDLGTEKETEVLRCELETLGVRVRDNDDADPLDPARSQDSATETEDDVYIPKVSPPKDTLIMYAIPPGYYARRCDSGSVMLHKLKEVLEKIQKDDSLLAALTKVAGKVAEEYEYQGKKDKGTTYKVVPVINHRLRHDLYFTKK